MEFKPLPTEIDDFKKIIDGNYYYVDKTLMIKELWDMRGEANLFTLPRRFGKTLNMSMLQYFFENTGSDELNGKNRELFIGLKIMEAGELYTELMGQYPVIILIDEYDVPLENAYFNGFYEEMIQFIRSLFESALKTNSSLEFAVITGCLRITKESIFSGLNNLKVISILSEFYGEHFGFTQAEVDDMLAFYGREKSRETLKHWYDGYLFGGKEVYNPWSVINYVEFLMGNEDAFPKPYWSNTSGNSIVKDLVENANIEVRGEIENLIDGETIGKLLRSRFMRRLPMGISTSQKTICGIFYSLPDI